jgi:hypothetical protein
LEVAIAKATTIVAVIVESSMKILEACLTNLLRSFQFQWGWRKLQHNSPQNQLERHLLGQSTPSSFAHLGSKDSNHFSLSFEGKGVGMSPKVGFHFQKFTLFLQSSSKFVVLLESSFNLEM